MKRTGFLLFLLLVSGSPLFAAEPPTLVNYQGVLRDAFDNPIDGDRDMTFRFFDTAGGAPPCPAAGGTLLLTDDHLAAGTGAVNCSGGLFSAKLGGGAVTAGTATTLAEVFRDHQVVYLEVVVAGEVLCPRVQMVASGFALNADHLDGRDSTQFIDTSPTWQTKVGGLEVNNGTDYGRLGWSQRGVDARGQEMGGYFSDADGGAVAEVAVASYGIRGIADYAGGYFTDDINFPSTAAHAGYTESGTGFKFGIWAEATYAGGYFADSNGTGYARAGYGNYGIQGYGSFTGGYFADSDSTGYAHVGYGDYGIISYGSYAGGYFDETDSNAVAFLARNDIGISASGDNYGGFFQDSNDFAYATVGVGTTGIQAYGDSAGAYFADSDSTGNAWVGIADDGIYARGSLRGGHFADTDGTSETSIAWGNLGIDASGATVGGVFDNTGSTGVANVGYYNYGVYAYGSYTGGYFYDTNSTGVARVGYSTYKIQGTGSVSFVQNHPYEPESVIVYNSPEGPEVATYTRGTARLVDGLAQVSLGETFEWVTNPDIGLTAHLTPRDHAVPLAVVSLTPDELVVRGSADSPPDLVFDYIVYGLRIGFEEVSVVQEKQEEAYIPSMTEHRELYARAPELRRHNALERFKGMGEDVGAPMPDWNASSALKAAVREYDPEVHGVFEPRRLEGEENQGEPPRTETPEPGVVVPDDLVESEPAVVVDTVRQSSARVPVDDEGNVYGKSFRPSATDLASVVGVTEPVEAGDVLVIDRDRPGMMSLARQPRDSAVFGIVAREPGVMLGAEPPTTLTPGLEPEGDDPSAAPLGTGPEAPLDGSRTPVAVSGVAQCKVDAGYGSILPGDLLTTSPTPGHAMRADDLAAGTVLGKALEPLDTGTGMIKVLVMLR